MSKWQCWKRSQRQQCPISNIYDISIVLVRLYHEIQISSQLAAPCRVRPPSTATKGSDKQIDAAVLTPFKFIKLEIKRASPAKRLAFCCLCPRFFSSRATIIHPIRNEIWLDEPWAEQALTGFGAREKSVGNSRDFKMRWWLPWVMKKASRLLRLYKIQMTIIRDLLYIMSSCCSQRLLSSYRTLSCCTKWKIKILLHGQQKKK